MLFHHIWHSAEAAERKINSQVLYTQRQQTSLKHLSQFANLVSFKYALCWMTGSDYITVHFTQYCIKSAVKMYNLHK